MAQSPPEFTEGPVIGRWRLWSWGASTDWGADRARRAQRGPIVARWHDSTAAQAAEDAFVKQFREKEVPDEIPDLALPEPAETALDLVAAVPGVKSRGEARRLVQGGGVTLGELKLASWDQPLPPDAVGQVLKVGKRRIFRLAPPS